MTSHLRLLASAILVSALISGNVLAQQLEEIVVTATHRAENIQDIPVTVTAIGRDQLEKSDIFDPTALALRVPGMTYGEFAPGQALISLRGIISADDGAGLDNSVALFLDGVYIGRGASINFDMFDLERIEVLRGPQGTLFGRNAIGGALNVVTQKPSDEPVVRVGGTMGNYDAWRYQALVSGPISDNVSGKISVAHREHSGYVDNIILGIDHQDENQTSVRAQLRWETDRSDWLFSADWMEDDRGDMGRTPLVDAAPLSVILDQNGLTGPRQNGQSRDGHSKRDVQGVAVTGEIDFEKGLLTSISAFRHVETDWEMLSVGAPLGGLGLAFDEVVDDIVEEIDTLSQEFRWTSRLGGNFEYTAGLYFLREETDRTEIFRITAPGTYGDPNLPFRLTDVGTQDIVGNEYSFTGNETSSVAVYAQGTYNFTDAWSLTLGGRYTRDEKDYVAESVNCQLVFDNDPSIIGTPWEDWAACDGVGGSLNVIAEAFRVEPSDTWTDFSPKVAVQFQANEKLMFFGAIAKGFKSGGFAGSQGVEAVAADPVSQETAINYELGFKGDFLGDTLRINMTAFYTDYEDLQIVRFGPVPASPFGTFITTNIGSADISGLETEFTWFATDNLMFAGNLALLDTDTSDLIINGVDLSGSVLRQAPETSYNLLASYNQETGIGEFNYQVEYSHVDEQIMDYVQQLTVIQEHSLLDARIGWTSNDQHWEVALWGKNLAEDDYISHSYVIGPGVIGVWGAPRTYGVNVIWNMN
jgi:iron complex outermembrane receptor protein